ncbi:MAG: molybdopterin oxidoreductase family protein [Bacteroidia bacterium]|nr:molybdopterin oxidoreductase family protein [Bacteroidia bacterium]
MPEIHYRTCNLCEALCGIEVHHEDGVVTKIRGDKADPFSKGHICPKAVALKDVYEDPNRLKKPVKRTENGWEEISWEEAYEMMVSGIKSVQAKYGTNSVGVYQGNPNVHNLGSSLFSPNFVRSLNTHNRFSATSVDQLPHHIVAHFMFGHPLSIPIPDIDRTDFMLIMGGNPLVSNGSLMTAPDFAGRLKALQARGGKFIVIDPRRTETADKADEHIFVKPGSDAYLLAAMLHTLFEEKLVAPGALADHLEGMEGLAEYFAPFSPEEMESLCGVPASKIRSLTHEFAQADKAVIYGRLGLSVQVFGGLCNWMFTLLNLLTGNIDSEGGAMFTQPVVDLVLQRGKKGKERFARWKSRVRGLPEFGGELPVSALSEDILTAGEGQIKAMITIAGNPVLSTPDGGKLDTAFEQLEFMAAIDIYINETTRHAHLILPPTTGLEVDQYDIAFHGLAIRNTSKFSKALFTKREEQRHDYEIYQELTDRMKEKKSPHYTSEQMLAFAISGSTYAKGGLSLEKLKEEVHGVDLGPLNPCLKDRLLTDSGKIELSPQLFLDDLKRLRSMYEKRKEDGTSFSLIGRRHLRSNNSWMHNSQRLVKGPVRCTALIHPEDARSLKIEDKEEIRISSRVGSVDIPAEISDEIMQGVISIPHGWGHGRKGIKMDIASAHAGVSINDLTDPLYIDELTGNAALNGVAVRVEKI